MHFDHTHPRHQDHGHDCGAALTPMQELTGLMQYLIGHNAAHAGELRALAEKLRDGGRADACGQILEAVEDFTRGNERLSAVLEALKQDV